MAEVSSLQNIGKELESKLRGVGINTAEELMQAGSREAFVRLKAAYPQVCLVHLYALQGAVEGRAYNSLDEGTKRALKEFTDALK